MNNLKQRMIRSLDALDAGRPLVALIDDLIRNYPDLFLLAKTHAAQILRKHTGRDMDPRFVWWHQFNSESSSNRSFTGWQHSGPPQKSLLMTELVIDRFDLHFQDAADELDQRGGFYRQGPHAGSFDERNEVPMLGSEVQKDLWALDFAQLYRDQVEQFWLAHGGHFALLAKLNLLGQAMGASRAGRISPQDAQRLRSMVSSELAEGALPSLAVLERGTQAPLPVYRYMFGPEDRGCLLALEMSNGRLLAYMPWSDEALKAFASELELASWLSTQLQSVETLGGFVSGAHANPRDLAASRVIRGNLLTVANASTDQAALAALNGFRQPLGSDLFAWMAQQAADEMHRTANLMRDNARLRKAMCSGYLAAFLSVFGGLAPLGWPVSLSLLGAGIGKVGLDVDEALHASDERGRRAALRSAMLESVYATLNMVDIGFQTSFASLEYVAPPHEANASLEGWQAVAAASLPVEGQESNVLGTGETVQAGRLRGIRVNEDGSCWIVLNGLSYRVRFSSELQVWLVVPADNPFAFGPLHPVRLNDAGEWELLQPPRLLAGAPPAVEGMQSVTSQFWDTYVLTNGTQSRGMSALALQRQKALLKRWPIAELERGRAPDLDERGLDCVSVRGRRYYSYRYGNQYFNTLIEYYTSDEAKVNDVFRSGTYQYGDEDSFIMDLADTLGLLPKNNQAKLYRGGNRSRGTSGEYYRNGHLRVGDVLVNTDLTSFTENPYKVAEFASLPGSEAPEGLPGVFDDSSVVFELSSGTYHDAVPISAFSQYWDEAESLFLPGHYFRIEGLEQVYGERYRFIKVTLKQVGKPASGVIHDLRTALPFDLSAYRARFRSAAVAARFFPS
ncbi:dermonecrotic toxin domain-containing protein [Pseudomonas fluorescens]|jgi:hypothetical protein|uniref:dermonecrotic toxin domain-containing protein n=1 Tax=Pseudomonas fluorescens TaxID=294 RepID=UPI0020C4000C|nr:DUF6543 domain-containing protein [Pseudomonas fluorescens]UTL89940.1 hypothetical protein NLL86_21215 [Pseudomonas fluorescens]